MRWLGARLTRAEIAPYLDQLATQLQRNCPHGVGRGGEFELSRKEMEEVVREGARWALKRGYATEMDLERTEENGRIAGADADKIGPRAYERARDQLGTLGAGNHFIEVDVVDEVFDETAAAAMGLFPGQIVACLLYTSDAADERSSVDLGGRRIIKKKKVRESMSHVNIQYNK